MSEYAKYEGKTWGELTETDREFLLRDVFVNDLRTGAVIDNGYGMIHFCETLVAVGNVKDGRVILPDDAELYNPCIGEGGRPIPQEELDAEFEAWKAEQEMSNNEYDEIELLFKQRPHVVILGAGASVAAILNGDKNGQKISAMAGFVDKLGMRDIIDGCNLTTTSDNLEDIYMEMYDRPECDDARKELENRIEDYFLSFEIPDEPTAYDFLLLGLTSKDLVATFNWDPLLLQAYNRCSAITQNLPELAFLHGNVGIGLCEKDKVAGPIWSKCSKCGGKFEKIPLLYPVKNKDYSSNRFIADSWNLLKHYLKKAYRVTIFGYSAPKSDVAAIGMLKQAWGDWTERKLEEIEMIDVADEDKLHDSWQDFIHTHHYSVHRDIFSSAIGSFPRRTCEALFDNKMAVRWLDGRGKGFKPDMSFDDIEKLIRPLLKNELDNDGKTSLMDPYVARG